MSLPEAAQERYSETEDCAICFERLVIPNAHDDGPSHLIDDVQLLCGPNNAPGHHFHWACLQEFDEDWDRSACPVCRGNPLNAEGHLVVIVRNEGGVTAGFDIGVEFDEDRLDDSLPPQEKKEKALRSLLAFGELEEAEELLQEGVNPDAPYEGQKTTAMHMAAYNDDVEQIELLLRYGANKTLISDNGQTALDIAKEVNATNAAKFLED